MDGLGGCPYVTFGELKIVLEQKGHMVILSDIEGIATHEDRIQRVLTSFFNVRAKAPDEKIFLVGQSSGGSAVRIAAEKLAKKNGEENQGSIIAGVIMLSPAMPRSIFFTTSVLAKVMAKRWLQLVLGQVVATTEAEFEALVAPLSAELRDTVIAHRQPISAKEGRQLAFRPAKFEGYPFPTLHIYGDHDHWISPRAQEKLNAKLRTSDSAVETLVVPGSGHITLTSEKRHEVISLITSWIEKI